MTIQTNTTDRKALAQAISEEINEPVRYLGLPSYAYQVGPYTVDREAAVHGENLEPLHAFLLRQGYIAEEQQPSGQADSGAEAPPDHCLSVPFPGFTSQWLGNLLRMLYARQSLLAAMLHSDLYRIGDDLITALDAQEDDLRRISELLCQVPGIRLEDGKLFFELLEEQDRAMACGILMMAIIDRARQSHRVRRKRMDPPEGEMKYHCYSWLVQLGLAGAEHKTARRVLLEGLPGYAAFRTAEGMEAHKARISERRKEAKREEVNGND